MIIDSKLVNPEICTGIFLRKENENYHLNLHPKAWAKSISNTYGKKHFALWIKKKLDKKEFLKSQIVLLMAEQTYTIKSSLKGRSANAS